MTSEQSPHTPEGTHSKSGIVDKLKAEIFERLPELEHASYKLWGHHISSENNRALQTATSLEKLLTNATPSWITEVVSRIVDSASKKILGLSSDAKVESISRDLLSILTKQMLRAGIKVPTIEASQIENAVINHEIFATGIEHIHMEFPSENADVCIAPRGSVPQFEFVKDIAPSIPGEKIVAANFDELAKDLPPNILMLSAAGWFSGDIITYADSTTLIPNEGITEQSALQEFVRRAMISLGAKKGDEAYSVDDFFKEIKSWNNEKDYTGRIYFPVQEPHWIVTSSDNSFSVQSLSQLRAIEDTSSIESITPTLGILDSTNMDLDNYNKYPIDLNGAILFTDEDGQQRIATIQGGVKANSKDIMQMATKMIEKTGNVSEIKILLFDGGRSRGTIVDTGNGREIINAYQQKTNRHALPACMTIRK